MRRELLSIALFVWYVGSEKKVSFFKMHKMLLVRNLSSRFKAAVDGSFSKRWEKWTVELAVDEGVLENGEDQVLFCDRCVRYGMATNEFESR